MAENENATSVPQETPEPTKDQLIAELEAAMASGDWKLVSTASGKIAKMAAAEEKAEKDALIAMVAEHEVAVKAIIDEALEGYDFPVEAEGVWYSWDFGDGVTGLRMLKTSTAAKAKATGGGGGKKYSISTAELVEKHGHLVKESGEGAGSTFKELFEGNTDDNYRYFKVRVPLLKAAGVSG